jgi:hypothetical protein
MSRPTSGKRYPRKKSSSSTGVPNRAGAQQKKEARRHAAQPAGSPKQGVAPTTDTARHSSQPARDVRKDLAPRGAGMAGKARPTQPAQLEALKRPPQRGAAQAQVTPRRSASAIWPRYQQVPPRWQRPIVVGAIGASIVVVVVFVIIANRPGQGPPAGIGQPVAANVLQEVTAVSPPVISSVGTGGLPDPLRSISGPALSANGKPELLYVGAEFCPYCAAERWSLVNALSRFGTFSHLTYMRSVDDDGDYATVTFRGSSYTSPYLSFVPVENADRSDHQLQPLTSQQSQLFSSLGGNGYPFLDLAGRFANDAPHTYSSGYDPSVLTGLSWAQIAAKLSNPHDPVTQDMIGNANYLTAAICKVTNNTPGTQCASQTIQQIEGKLPG